MSGIIYSRTYPVTVATLTEDTIKALIAADLGIDNVGIQLSFKLEADDYDGPGCPTYHFDRLEVKIVQTP